MSGITPTSVAVYDVRVALKAYLFYFLSPILSALLFPLRLVSVLPFIGLPIGYPGLFILLECLKIVATEAIPGIYASDLSTLYYGVCMAAIPATLIAGLVLHFSPALRRSFYRSALSIPLNDDDDDNDDDAIEDATAVHDPLEEALMRGYNTRALLLTSLLAQAALTCASNPDVFTNTNPKVLDELACLHGLLLAALHAPLLARTAAILLVSSLTGLPQLVIDLVVIPAIAPVRWTSIVRLAPGLEPVLETSNRKAFALRFWLERLRLRFRTWMAGGSEHSPGVFRVLGHDVNIAHVLKGAYVAGIGLLMAQTTFMLLLGLFRPFSIMGVSWYVPGVRFGEITWTSGVQRVGPTGTAGTTRNRIGDL